MSRIPMETFIVLAGMVAILGLTGLLNTFELSFSLSLALAGMLITIIQKETDKYART